MGPLPVPGPEYMPVSVSYTHLDVYKRQALDWWNGNRSVLADTKLSGVLLGLTLQTKPEDIFRAVLEATDVYKRQEKCR